MVFLGYHILTQSKILVGQAGRAKPYAQAASPYQNLRAG
jgi:hypothetical protein